MNTVIANSETLRPRLEVSRKDGTEQFRDGNALFEFNLLDFWQWSASDLVSNALRGRLAEYLVAQALGIANGVRAEWDAYDLCTSENLTIEVKSAAYVQTWAQRKDSRISFDISPSRHWCSETAQMATDMRRHADLYVFALLGHQERATIEPLDLSQWTFFVVRTAVLNERFPTQKQLGLKALESLPPHEQCGFEELKDRIELLNK